MVAHPSPGISISISLYFDFSATYKEAPRISMQIAAQGDGQFGRGESVTAAGYFRVSGTIGDKQPAGAQAHPFE
jgi:hypothetical protein